jgi:two-component system nitrate/nitrite response regulator NarL
MDVRVMVASEVRLYREGLLRVLQGAAGIVMIGIASSAEEVVEQTSRLMPAVVLLDIAMAKALSTVRNFTQAPRIRGVVILGIPETYADIVACLPAGVVRFVKQDGTVADLHSAIIAAGGGEIAALQPAARRFDPAAGCNSSGGMDSLTAREMEILRLIQQGLSNKTISRTLGIELSTVKNHVHSILAKLGARSRSEAISLLYRLEQSEPGWGAALLERVESISSDKEPAVA